MAKITIRNRTATYVTGTEELKLPAGVSEIQDKLLKQVDMDTTPEIVIELPKITEVGELKMYCDEINAQLYIILQQYYGF